MTNDEWAGEGVLEKAALKRPHSKRFASDEALGAARQRLECGRFSAAFARVPFSRRVIRHSSFVIGHFLLLCTAAQAQISYEKDIAPIFRTYCAGCHNATEHENDFSVETYAALRKGGSEKGEPIQPGDAASSFLIKSIEGRARPHMPPKDEPQVPAAELALLKQWITDGARGPKQDVSILETLVVPEIKTAPGVRQPFTAAAWSPDGKQLVVAFASRVELRSSPRAKARRVFEGLPGKVNAVHFSPDGKQLITASGITGLSGVAQLWNVADGKKVREFGGHRDVLYDAELSPDGQTLATAGYDRVIKLWRVRDGVLLRSIAVHNGAIFDLAFSPDGAVLASASADQTVKLWRVADGLRLDTLNQSQGEVNAVAFTPDGQHIAAAGNDKRIYLWRFVATNGPAINPMLHARFAHEAAISTFALHADGKSLVTAAADRSLKVWSVPELVEQFAYAAQPDLVAALAAAPKRKEFLAARLDGSLEVLEVKSARRSVGLRPGPNDQRAGSETGTPKNSSSPATNAIAEVEPNDTPAEAATVLWPAQIKGTIARPGDTDLFRFRARAGQEFTLAINASQSKSRLDSRLEVLHADGRPVEQVVLQATRDSWFTFRGKDSDNVDDFRVHNWAEMELDEYFYANGEVVKLWLYPRGPDSGFKVYPGEGKRQTFFGTTALTHALNEPGYIVTPLPRGVEPVPNGLPVYRLNYENDDDPSRRAGADSVLLFTAPSRGDYLVRVSDTRGFGGTNFFYTLAMRERRPDFSVTVEGKNPKVSPGSGREISFVARREEGFDGPIRIELTNLPAGFTASGPVEIEAGQIRAEATLHAAVDATAPDTNADRAVKIIARARIQGREVTHELGTLGNIQLTNRAKLTVEILPGQNRSYVKETPGQPLEFTIRPGQTISALVRATRHDFKERIELGKEEAGSNLPHGVYVDNIGLNGLLIVEGQSEREFFITASKIARPGRRLFHLRASGDGGQVSQPVWLNVQPTASRVTASR